MRLSPIEPDGIPCPHCHRLVACSHSAHPTENVHKLHTVDVEMRVCATAGLYAAAYCVEYVVAHRGWNYRSVLSGLVSCWLITGQIVPQ